MKNLILALCLVSACQAEDLSPYPKKDITPGLANPLVTQENIQSTICTHDFNASQRPSGSYTYKVKLRQIREYGYPQQLMSDYIEDHIIPIAVGGHPTDPGNLWPQPKSLYWSDRKKDKLEVKIWHKVCKGLMPLSEAQAIFLNDWVSGYKAYVK